MDLPAFLLVHTITVEAYEGTTGYGAPSYADPVEVACFVDEKSQLVRGPTGDKVTSTGTVYAPLDTVAPPESRVTLASGRVATVINALRRDGGGLPTPDHLELQLT